MAWDSTMKREGMSDEQGCPLTDGGKESVYETACFSVVPNLNSISDWNTGDEHKRLEFIKEDCLARLKDVRETNEKAKSLSAFMSILALMGMLAKLAFSKNTSFNPKYSNECGSDQAQFQAFCDYYLLGDPDYEQKINDIGLSYLLYKYVRCGLLHGGTLTNTRVTTKLIYAKVYLTHRGSSEQTLTEMNSRIKLASVSNEVSVTLDAAFLCNELGSAIEKMFNDHKQEIKDSILKTFEEEPPILCTLSE